MSIRNIMSNTIRGQNQWEEQVKSELNIVNSYLSIDEWRKEITFEEILKDKLKMARLIKKGLMKLYEIKDHKEVVGFRCQACPAVFDWPTALGGHMSKAHPNHKRKILMESSVGIEDEIRQSSLQRIKKEEILHYETTRIHRDQSYELSLGN